LPLPFLTEPGFLCRHRRKCLISAMTDGVQSEPGVGHPWVKVDRLLEMRPGRVGLAARERAGTRQPSAAGPPLIEHGGIVERDPAESGPNLHSHRSRGREQTPDPSR
jgi:hypothetical protein